MECVGVMKDEELKLVKKLKPLTLGGPDGEGPDSESVSLLSNTLRFVSLAHLDRLCLRQTVPVSLGSDKRATCVHT